MFDIFYKSLNANNKAIADTVIKGDFMSLLWGQASTILNRIT